MILTRRVSLNDVQLDSLDGRILIQGVEDGTPRRSVNAVSIYGTDGQRMTGDRREALDITVRFAIMLGKRQAEERDKIFDKVLLWASSGGWLRYSGKPGKMIYVKCTATPGVGDYTQWNSDYSLTFRAYGVPYWVSETETQKSAVRVSSKALTLSNAGTTKSPLEMEFTNNSTECNTVQISANGRVIRLTDLGLETNETLVIDHDSDGLQRIRIRDTDGVYRSAMASRTEASADEVWLFPGSNRVTLSAQKAGDITVRCRGRFL